MFSANRTSDASEQMPMIAPRQLRRGLHRKRRHAFRPGLESMEARCLLSGYSITSLTYPGGHLVTAGAINKLGQVAGQAVIHEQCRGLASRRRSSTSILSSFTDRSAMRSTYPARWAGI